MAAIHIANDLERVGDLAKNTAKRVIAIEGNFGRQRLVAGVEHIAELALAPAQEGARRLSPPATSPRRSSVWERDDEIDAMYTSLFRELLTYMMEDPRNITFCTHLLFCAKNLERIGDHATNIAETLHYLITGAAARRRAAEEGHVQPDLGRIQAKPDERRERGDDAQRHDRRGRGAARR